MLILVAGKLAQVDDKLAQTLLEGYNWALAQLQDDKLAQVNDKPAQVDDKLA